MQKVLGHLNRLLSLKSHSLKSLIQMFLIWVYAYLRTKAHIQILMSQTAFEKVILPLLSNQSQKL